MLYSQREYTGLFKEVTNRYTTRSELAMLVMWQKLNILISNGAPIEIIKQHQQ